MTMLLASHFTSLTSKMLSVSTSDHASVVSLNLFVALLCACIVIGHLLEEHRWINESITALLIVISSILYGGRIVSSIFIEVLAIFLLQGLATGVVILLISRGKNSHLLVFSEDLFFIYLLPPIIFNAG